MAATDLVALGLVAWMCGKVALEAKADGKWVKFVLWVVGCALAVFMCLSIIGGILFLPYDWMFVPMILAPLVVIPWGATAKNHFDEVWLKLVGLFLSAFAFFFAIETLSSCRDCPLRKSWVEYNSQSQLEELLGVKGMPELEYDKALNTHEGVFVRFMLNDTSKVNELYEVYDMLIEDNMAHCLPVDDWRKFYQIVNNTTGDYFNFCWRKDGIDLTYNHSDLLISKNDNRSDFFGFGNNPLPKHKCLTFAERYGYYREISMRIQFEQPISKEWLNRWKEMAVSVTTVSGEKDTAEGNNKRHTKHTFNPKNQHKPITYKEDDQMIEICIHTESDCETSLTIFKESDPINPVGLISCCMWP